MSMGYKPEGETTIFIFGLLSLIMCAPLGIFAWIQGNSYIAQCRAMGVEPDSLAVAGRIMGIIACVMMVVGLGAWFLFICLGVMGAMAGM